MSKVTDNKNFLSPVGFNLKINSNEYPNLEYFITQITLPDVELGTIEVPRAGQVANMVGDTTRFGALACSFRITEHMENYSETFDWLNQARLNGETATVDGILTVLNSKNNLTKQIRFKDCFPTSLGGITFDIGTTDASEFLIAEVSFAFTTFEFI